MWRVEQTKNKLPSPAPPCSIPTADTIAEAALTASQTCPETQPAAEHRARHLRLCQELIEIGMTLARAAADRALDDIAAAPPAAKIPGSSAGAIAQAEERARHRTPDYGKLFAHLSRAVRQTILLEAAIAEGALPASRNFATQSHTSSAPAPSPDRDAIHPDTLRRDTLERLDCALPAGPHGEIPVEDLLLTISQKFGLDRAPAQTPDRRPAEPESAPHPASPAPVRAAPEPPKRRPRW